MKHFYYSENEQQFGPFTLEEMKGKRLTKSMLVWADGMNDWTTAERVNELKNFVLPEPPPIPTSSVQDQRGCSYAYKADEMDRPEFDKTVLGICLLICTLILSIYFKSYSEIVKGLLGLSSLVLRAIICLFVYRMAKRYNRSTITWALFAFFFPSIALIVLGYLRPLRIRIYLDQKLSDSEKINWLIAQGEKFYAEDHIHDAFDFAKRILEIQKDNSPGLALHRRAMNSMA
jgi:hypothetical protein